MLIKRIGPTILYLIAMTSMAAKADGPEISLMRDSGGTDHIDPIVNQMRRGLRRSHGAYFFVDGSTGQPPTFYTLNREGLLVASARFAYSGQDSFNETSSERMSNGTFVFGGMTVPRSSGRDLSSFLAWISADGHDQHTVSMGKYLPYLVAVGSDETIWTIGYEVDTSSDDWRINENAKVLRHFDQTGKLLQAALSLSDFKPFQQNPRMEPGLIAVSKDKLGWFGYLSNGNATYAEVSLPDFSVSTYPGVNLLSDNKLLDPPIRLAMTDGGTASVWIQRYRRGSPRAYIFDSSRKWVPIEVPRLSGFVSTPALIGAENEDLVFRYGRESAFFRVQQ